MTPYSQRRIHSAVPAPSIVITGAAHDSGGKLIRESLRLGGAGGDHVVMIDPEILERPTADSRLAGTWLYGGHWMGQFGHFILETLTSLWPEGVNVDGILLHSFVFGSAVKEWQREFLSLLNRSEQIRVVDSVGYVVQELIVPSRPFVINGWASEECLIPWRTISESAPSTQDSERVFLSRTSFNQSRTNHASRSDAVYDEELDSVFRSRGFRVASPEQLTISEQVGLVKNAKIIAGTAGSALHLSAFAPKSARIIEIGDRRSPNRPLVSQAIIDSLLQHETCHIGYRDSVDRMALVLDELLASS